MKSFGQKYVHLSNHQQHQHLLSDGYVFMIKIELIEMNTYMTYEQFLHLLGLLHKWNLNRLEEDLDSR